MSAITSLMSIGPTTYTCSLLSPPIRDLFATMCFYYT